jgi:hypothetical protein
MENIRLDKQSRDAICTAFKNNFNTNDHLWLFGSRVDLTAKGGDIDLYIETSYKEAGQIVNAKIQFLSELYMTLGEQKIDVIIKSDDLSLAIYKVAKTEGVKLI